jgi:L,D-transpeptidase ErfK/SrfK
VNIVQRMLFVFRDGEVFRAMPVAVGRADWPTPLGTFAIAVKEIDPVWDVPRSIQEEMARLRQPVLTKVAPGPGNPLGNRWLGLTAPSVGIHGTNQPASIYRFATHGCIRVHPDDMLELFDLVTAGTSVELTYEPVLVTRSRGVTFLEVHRDVYGRTGAGEARVNHVLREAGLEALIGSPDVRRALAEQAARAVIVGEEDVMAQPPSERH